MTTLRSTRRALVLGALPLAIALTACGGSSSGDTAGAGPVNAKPSYIRAVSVLSYNGSTDDLLTGGLGWDGLAGAAPAVSATPTAAELRRRAIYNNYRALVDFTAAGGYGRLYGPNVALDGTVNAAAGAGKIAGKEYIAYADPDGTGRVNVVVMAQIPASFDPANPCIVTATSSGSRGVYGAVSAAGEWGLKRGCAVAYTDKGSGNGGHELGSGIVTFLDGTLGTAASLGAGSHFTANVLPADLAAFNAANPFRYAFKHAHSQQNPEKDWGRNTLQAVEFTLWALNEEYGPVGANGVRGVRITPANTTVIAAGVSNGGGAALAAAEQDAGGLIDAVVVGEPQINLRLPAGLQVQRGGNNVAAFGRTLYDYTTLANLLQPCAAYAPANAASPFLAAINATIAQNRCAALAAAGVITGATFADQANAALAALRAAGWEADSDLLHASHWATQATPGVAVTYANAYSRASVTENLCGFSFATTSATTGQPAAAAASPMGLLFAQGNGVPPTGGVNLVVNSAAGPILHTLADGNAGTTGALCLRALWTGTDAAATKLKAGVDEIRLTGNLRGKPAIIVHGRSDALVPMNHTTRPYFGMNRLAEGASSKLSVIEVTNAQHFDTFIAAVPGYADRYIPMHHYNIQALNQMWAHLKSSAPLPASQVVRTVPRGTGAPAIDVAANLPPIVATPAAGNAISFNAGVVNVPE
ncbi:3-hydroxybutyrate oligomer hydrolase family protein [Piscinibacterium candidicorallinum]|uniref:D-(-)-3-hydroxybutyrate oligomer hydrolase n=1 Tax=Piscinibacterium candidicorallinum TaxID=1793872 RepID=A0ABV7H8I3_9BURK